MFFEQNRYFSNQNVLTISKKKIFFRALFLKIHREKKSKSTQIRTIMSSPSPFRPHTIFKKSYFCWITFLLALTKQFISAKPSEVLLSANLSACYFKTSFRSLMWKPIYLAPSNSFLGIKDLQDSLDSCQNK